MALNNSQFDTILRGYQRIQSQHRREQRARMDEAFARIPRLREIDGEVAEKSVACARQLINREGDSLPNLKAQIRALGEERQKLLREAGYPADYLDLTYTCPFCQDTGFIGNEKCRCFKKAEIDLLYTQSNLAGILEKENFSTFSFSYYSDEITDESGRITSLERCKKVVEHCRRFVDRFDSEFDNLFFYGDTGTGKTFLSHCIAKELLESSHSVLYFSARELFEEFARQRFGHEPGQAEQVEHLYDCDLLILDDLGTELTNSFVSAELFSCINERLIHEKSTIISTNLSLDSFASVYSERIFSRISSGYTMLKLFGSDIRIQKKLQRNSDKKSLNN